MSMEQVARAVKDASNMFGVPIEDIYGKRRTRTVVRARQFAMALIRNRTSMSFPEIGGVFGKDHSTVIHAVKRIKEEYGLVK